MLWLKVRFIPNLRFEITNECFNVRKPYALVLVGLYEEPERPVNAIEYIKMCLGVGVQNSNDIDVLKNENNELKTKVKDLEAQNDDLKARLRTLSGKNSTAK